jgi:hypothetical protein
MCGQHGHKKATYVAFVVELRLKAAKTDEYSVSHIGGQMRRPNTLLCIDPSQRGDRSKNWWVRVRVMDMPGTASLSAGSCRP